MIDYVYKHKFADNYVTSFVPVCHMQGGYDLVDVFDNVFVIFPQCDDGFPGDCGFLLWLGALTWFEISCFSLEAIINLKYDKSHDQIGEHDRKWPQISIVPRE